MLQKMSTQRLSTRLWLTFVQPAINAILFCILLNKYGSQAFCILLAIISLVLITEFFILTRLFKKSADPFDISRQRLVYQLVGWANDLVGWTVVVALCAPFVWLLTWLVAVGPIFAIANVKGLQLWRKLRHVESDESKGQAAQN